MIGCAVHAAVARSRLASGHAGDGLPPYLRHRQLACSRARDGFQPSRVALLQPQSAPRKVGERGVEHLVDQHPVVREGSRTGVGADTDARCRPGVAERGRMTDPVAGFRQDQKTIVGHWCLAEVADHSLLAATDPGEDRGSVKPGSAIGKDDPDLAVADRQSGGRLVPDCRVKDVGVRIVSGRHSTRDRSDRAKTAQSGEQERTPVDGPHLPTSKSRQRVSGSAQDR